jgi:rubrerythrin
MKNYLELIEEQNLRAAEELSSIINDNQFDDKEKVNELLSTIPTDPKTASDSQLLRVGILAELDAVNLYEQMASVAKDPKIKKVLLDVAKEEKTHVGEFLALLNIIDKESENELLNGKKEVDES